ncbi:hypothetical protein EJ071_02510 [Mesorhizobium sp. M1B.F.Ca.ET.045.04.1.1]|nr:hypothetical protein EJ071_02510 [Mesorhizobium sp. M1B.F.Ca.ET.045.04.1.1]
MLGDRVVDRVRRTIGIGLVDEGPGLGVDQFSVVGHSIWTDFGGRAWAPPSGLPAISPARGEIGSFVDGTSPSTSAIGESDGDIRSPLRGRCPVHPP